MSSSKCSKCQQKPKAYYCEECSPPCSYCYSCHNRFHDEISVFHRKVSVSSLFSPRRVSLRDSSYNSVLMTGTPKTRIENSQNKFEDDLEKRLRENRKKEAYSRINNLSARLGISGIRVPSNNNDSIRGDEEEMIDNEIKRCEEEFKEKQNKLKGILNDEEKRNAMLGEEMKRIAAQYDQQIDSLNDTLKKMKNEYENKLQEFEKLLKGYIEPIEKLQQNMKSSTNEKESLAELKTELANKCKIVERFQQGLKLSEGKSTEVAQTIEKILSSKAKIVEELQIDNECKENDIISLREICNGFKKSFEIMDAEKNDLVKENEKLAEELENARQIIMAALEKAKKEAGYELA